MSRLLTRKDLRRYQVIFANKIKKLATVILAVSMGAGKTGAVLTALVDLLDDREIKKVLIIAPLNVARATWADEINGWEHLRDLTYTVIRAEDYDDDVLQFRKDAYGTYRMIGLDAAVAASAANRAKSRYKERKRRALALTSTEVHIINREALPWLWDLFGKGKHWPYDAIVVDESSMFKNGKMRTPKKQLTRFGVVAKARKHAKKIVQMTGTPAPKGLINLWGQAYIADGGDRLGNSRFKFEQNYFDEDFMGWNLEPKSFAFDQIMSKMRDIMFSLPPEHYPELPGNTMIERKVSLPPEIMRRYREFEADLYSKEYDVEAVNKGVLHNKLLQFANGSIYNEDGQDVFIHDEKLDELENLVDEANGEPLLVAYSFKFDRDRIKKRFGKMVRVWGEGSIQKTKEDWNNRKIEFLLAHANSIGHGQNIQRGGNIGVWYGLTSDLEIYQQFNKRLDRPGQTKPVFTHHIVAEGTLDEELLPILKRRDSTQNDILRAVQIKL